MCNQASISGAKPCGERDVESRQAVRLPELEGKTVIDFTPATSERQLSWALWKSASSKYGDWMQSRRGSDEVTEDIHEMDNQNMASLGGFPSVQW